MDMSRGRPPLVTETAANAIWDAKLATRRIFEESGDISSQECRVLGLLDLAHERAEAAHDSLGTALCGLQGHGIYGERFQERARDAGRKILAFRTSEDDDPAGPGAMANAAQDESEAA
jgi:hypothetical protein